MPLSWPPEIFYNLIAKKSTLITLGPLRTVFLASIHAVGVLNISLGFSCTVSAIEYANMYDSVSLALTVLFKATSWLLNVLWQMFHFKKFNSRAFHVIDIVALKREINLGKVNKTILVLLIALSREIHIGWLWLCDTCEILNFMLVVSRFGE